MGNVCPDIQKPQQHQNPKTLLMFRQQWQNPAQCLFQRSEAFIQYQKYNTNQLKRLFQSARTSYTHQQYPQAQEKYKELIEYSRQLYQNKPNQKTAILLSELGVVLYNMGNYEKAFESFDNSIMEAKKALIDDQSKFRKWNEWRSVTFYYVQSLKANNDTEIADRIFLDYQILSTRIPLQDPSNFEKEKKDIQEKVQKPLNTEEQSFKKTNNREKQRSRSKTKSQRPLSYIDSRWKFYNPKQYGSGQSYLSHIRQKSPQFSNSRQKSLNHRVTETTKSKSSNNRQKTLTQTGNRKKNYLHLDDIYRRQNGPSYLEIASPQSSFHQIYMYEQSKDVNLIKLPTSESIQSQKDQEQADKKRKQGIKFNANRQYQKAYKRFQQALKLSIKCSKQKANERTAVIYNEIGVVLYNMGRFNEAVQMINLSLQEANKAMEIQGKQVQDWYHWKTAMGNLILALKRNLNTIAAATKLEKYMMEDFNVKNPFEQIIQTEHITAFFSSKEENNHNPLGLFIGHSDQNTNQYSSLKQLKIHIDHIQDISNQNRDITHTIIQNSCLRKRNNLSKKNELLEEIKNSFQDKCQKHVFIFSGQAKTGQMLIRTEDNPNGEPLFLEQIFDKCILSQQIQHIKSLKIYLDCDFSGSMAESLLKSMPQRNLKNIYNKNIKVICSSGSDSRNQDSEKFGGNLVCNYWQSRIPRKLNWELKDSLSKKFHKANPCMVEYIDESTNGTVQGQWAQIKSVTWDEIQTL